MGWRRGGARWFWRLGNSRGADPEPEGKARRPPPTRRGRGLGSLFSARAWRWRRPVARFRLLDDAVFCVLYVVEAIVLVAVFCFYFCRFGCRV